MPLFRIYSNSEEPDVYNYPTNIINLDEDIEELDDLTEILDMINKILLEYKDTTIKIPCTDVAKFWPCLVQDSILMMEMLTIKMNKNYLKMHKIKISLDRCIYNITEEECKLLDELNTVNIKLEIDDCTTILDFFKHYTHHENIKSIIVLDLETAMEIPTGLNLDVLDVEVLCQKDISRLLDRLDSFKTLKMTGAQCSMIPKEKEYEEIYVDISSFASVERFFELKVNTLRLKIMCKLNYEILKSYIDRTNIPNIIVVLPNDRNTQQKLDLMTHIENRAHNLRFRRTKLAPPSI